MDNSYEVIYLDRPFVTLLADAIQLALLAEHTPESHMEHVFARSAIMNAVFSLEAAANLTLDNLSQIVPSRLQDQIDRFPLIEKFEFFLFIRTGESTLDRGNLIVQYVRELIRLRNYYVHAKVKRYPAQVHELDEEKKTFKFEQEVEETQFLAIPKSLAKWNQEHAISAVKATVEFLNYYFVELCHFEAEETRRFLYYLLGGSVGISQRDYDLLKQCERKWSLRIEFLG